jgi:hypothetical protein
MWHEKLEKKQIKITLLLKKDTTSLLLPDLIWERESDRQIVSAVRAGGSPIFGTLIALKMFEIDNASLTSHVQSTLEKFQDEARIHVVVYTREHTKNGSRLYANLIQTPKLQKLVLELGRVRRANMSVCDVVYALLVDVKYLDEPNVRKIIYYNMKISTDLKKQRVYASVTMQDNQLYLLKPGLVWKRSPDGWVYGFILPVGVLMAGILVSNFMVRKIVDANTKKAGASVSANIQSISTIYQWVHLATGLMDIVFRMIVKNV